MRSTSPVASAPPDRFPVRAIAALFVATRAIAFAGMLWATGGNLGSAVRAASRLYDSAFYDIIVLHGYALDPQYGHAPSAFYPGYPAAVAAVYWPMHGIASTFLHGSDLSAFSEGALLPIATLLVCNLALVAALTVLWRLYSPRLGSRATLLGIGLLLAAPTSFFLSSGFSESLFILLVALAFLQAQRGSWLWAGLFAGLAALVRFPGALLIVPLAMLWVQQPRPRAWKPAVAGLLTFAVGAGAYPGWLWASTGDPLAYLHLQASHRRFLVGPVRAIQNMLSQAGDAVLALLGRPSNQRLVDVPTIAANSVALLAGVTTALAGWTRLRAYEIVWVGLVLVTPLLSGTGESLDRYWLAAFPFFFLLGAWLRRWPMVAGAVMVFSAAWLIILAHNFARVIWVG